MATIDEQIEALLTSDPAYVPTYEFAYAGGDENNPDRLYGFPATAPWQRTWLGGRNLPAAYDGGFDAYQLTTGQVPGVIEINPEAVPEAYRTDFDKWQALQGITQQRTDPFSFFGDQFLPALALTGLAIGGAGAFGGFSGAGAGAVPAAGAGLNIGAGEVIGGTLGPALTETAGLAGPGFFAGAAPAAGVGLNVGAGEVIGGTLGPALTETAGLAGPVVGGAGGVGGGLAPVVGGAADVGGAITPLGSLGTTPALTAPTFPAVGPAVGGGLLGSLGSLGTLGLIGPSISALGSIAGGLINRGAATDAAKTQADAAREANALQLAMFEQQRADLAPYREAGYAALGQLGGLAQEPFAYGAYAATPGIDPAAYAFNPQAYAFDPQAYAFDVNQYAFNPQAHAFDVQQYAFAPPSGEQVLRDDPGYQFRLDQGMKALERSAAARGSLHSAGNVRQGLRFAQDLASQEYSNAYNRALGRNVLGFERAKYGNELGYERDLAGNILRYGRAREGNVTDYERALQGNQLARERAFQENQLRYGRDLASNQEQAARARDVYATNFSTQAALRQQRQNELASLAGLGQTSLGQLGQLGAQTAASMGGNITSAGAAQAGGQIGAANALGSIGTGIGGAANALSEYAMLEALLRQRKAA